MMKLLYWKKEGYEEWTEDGLTGREFLTITWRRKLVIEEVKDKKEAIERVNELFDSITDALEDYEIIGLIDDEGYLVMSDLSLTIESLGGGVYVR